MTSGQFVETSVSVISNSPSQDYTHPNDRTLLNYIFTVVEKSMVLAIRVLLPLYFDSKQLTTAFHGATNVTMFAFILLHLLTSVSRFISSVVDKGEKR